MKAVGYSASVVISPPLTIILLLALDHNNIIPQYVLNYAEVFSFVVMPTIISVSVLNAERWYTFVNVTLLFLLCILLFMLADDALSRQGEPDPFSAYIIVQVGVFLFLFSIIVFFAEPRRLMRRLVAIFAVVMVVVTGSTLYNAEFWRVLRE